MSNLESSIIKTLAYFDVFDYPLTLIEVWRYLYRQQASLSEVQQALNSENLKEFIETQKGFYFLKGKFYLIDKRLKRYNISNEKFRRAKRITKLLRFLPFINLVAVCNNLSYNNATDKSDIDLFLMTSNKRIWIARFYSFLFLKILGKRPMKDKTKDKICISVLVSEDKMDLQELMIDGEDIHFVYWLSQFVLLYDQKNIWLKFVEANSWIRKYLPNGYFYLTNKRRLLKPSRFIKRFKEIFYLGVFGNLIEEVYKKIQLRIMPEVLKDIANKNTNVVITDQILKFHLNDRREEYRGRYLEKIKSLGL